MKSLGGGMEGKIPTSGLLSAKECIRFALSQPVSSLVVGMRNQRDLDQALEVGRNFQPLTHEQQKAVLEKVKLAAGDGRHELFKTSKSFDGPYHRKQHGFALD